MKGSNGRPCGVSAMDWSSRSGELPTRQTETDTETRMSIAIRPEARTRRPDLRCRRGAEHRHELLPVELGACAYSTSSLSDVGRMIDGPPGRPRGRDVQWTIGGCITARFPNLSESGCGRLCSRCRSPRRSRTSTSCCLLGESASTSVVGDDEAFPDRVGLGVDAVEDGIELDVLEREQCSVESADHAHDLGVILKYGTTGIATA